MLPDCSLNDHSNICQQIYQDSKNQIGLETEFKYLQNKIKNITNYDMNSTITDLKKFSDKINDGSKFDRNSARGLNNIKTTDGKIFKNEIYHSKKKNSKGLLGKIKYFWNKTAGKIPAVKIKNHNDSYALRNAVKHELGILENQKSLKQNSSYKKEKKEKIKPNSSYKSDNYTKDSLVEKKQQLITEEQPEKAIIQEQIEEQARIADLKKKRLLKI